MVPEKLNRGRHKVDPKKLKSWRERMKKSEVDTNLFYIALLAKANEANQETLVTLLRALTPTETLLLVEAIKDLSLDSSNKQ